MSEKVCVVVIPVHNPNPSLYELISFQQCFKILRSHPIKVIAPQGLSLDHYKKMVPEFEVVFIDPKWQSTLLNYNKLKLSRFFYRLFDEFEFLLTYELDAFVFSDDLEFWCNRNYDYIGAPWFEGYAGAVRNSPIIGVGNSGFSLRKITTMQKLLKEFYYLSPYDRVGKRKVLAMMQYPIRKLLNKLNENFTIQRYYDWYEDQFICRIAGPHFPGFKIAPIEEAVKFSFEVNAVQLFEMNYQNLPMGCHAWWRYDLNFWRPFIESYGYHLNT